MKATTETLRQGDRVTGTVTTIEHDGVSIELRAFELKGDVLISHIAHRVNSYEPLIQLLADIQKHGLARGGLDIMERITAAIREE